MRLLIFAMIVVAAFVMAGCAQQIACTQEAKICPDGSAVGRTGPNCEFAPCPQIVGNDSDSHGCKGSAGYSWCEAKQKCIRPFEENCTIGSNLSIEDQARSFCGSENVDKIFVCGGYVRTVSKLLGGGSTFYKDGEMVAQCPVVGPDSMSEQCRLLLFGNNCVETEISCQLVGNDSDSHGCKGSAGYSWCEAKQKCIRIWEEPCDGTLTGSEVRSIAEASCGSQGNLSDQITYNNNSKTYWIDIAANKPGCSPACVVWEENKSAEINWRCTGLLPSYTVKAANLSGFGEILTDGSGMSLYVFTADAMNKSNCAGACEKNWPPLVVSGDIVVPKGISGSFGAIPRADGTIQVTYNGMPLYTYVADNSPGDVKGEGVDGKWFVAKTEMTGFPK